MRALLDVNMLIAHCDSAHAFHQTAKHWMVDNYQQGWASCPITQNGCVRILSQPTYGNPRPLGLVLERVGEFCQSTAHEFWADDISLFDTGAFDQSKIHGHRQLTDLYLLALAVKRNGRLVTFDGQIPLSAVRGATKRHLVIL
jgi:toxin-antitoxin system PIN domain toxin